MSSGSRARTAKSGRAGTTSTGKHASTAPKVSNNVAGVNNKVNELSENVELAMKGLDSQRSSIADIQESIKHLQELVGYLEEAAITKDDIVVEHNHEKTDDDEEDRRGEQGSNQQELSKERKKVLVDLINSQHGYVKETVKEEFGKHWKAYIENLEKGSDNQKMKEGRGNYKSAIDLAKDEHSKIALQS